jgi:hypothetical protein
MANAIRHRSKTKYLFEVTKQATRFPAAKRFPFAEAANLELTHAIDRRSRPLMQFAKVLPVNAFRAFQFLMIPLHEVQLSGST